MTREQERVINQVRNYMLTRYGKREGDLRYEMKQEQIEEIGYGVVSVVFETGMINDEGTYAQIYCRDRVHLFIGKKGGVRTYVTARSGANKGKAVEYTDNWLGCCHRSMDEYRI